MKLMGPESSIFRKFGFPVSRTTVEDNRHELPAILWLWLPIGFFVLRYAISIFTDKHKGLESWMLGELGLVESLTVLFLVMSTLITLFLIQRYREVLHLNPRLFLVFYCIGCIYFAGEEASWGQHWFGWGTGEYFAEFNGQNETNLHNTSVFLNRVPKGIVSLLIFLGGVFAPLYFRRKALNIDCKKPMWWLFPTWVCLPAAIFATIATWPSKVERFTGWTFYFDQAQETKEFYIALFILLFIISLARRLQHYQATDVEFSRS